MSDPRQLAHELLDRLPQSQLTALVGLLETMVEPFDSVADALRNAPIDEEPESDQEKREVQEARDWLRNNGGKGIPHDEAMRRLGLK